MTVRVYVPSTPTLLREVLRTGQVGPAPVAAHAATSAVRRELADLGEEEWEYAASTAAAQASVALLGVDEPARRVVLAVDLPDAGPALREAGPDDPTRVDLDEVLPLALLAAVLADDDTAEATVGAARAALPAGTSEADRALERCLLHEPGWWGVQELDQLLA